MTIQGVGEISKNVYGSMTVVKRRQKKKRYLKAIGDRHWQFVSWANRPIKFEAKKKNTKTNC